LEKLSRQGKEPEIILMDIHLRGELDGIDTAGKITERFNCAIIFLTGQSSKEVYERSFRIKPFGYLLKPIDIEQMKMTIEIAAYQRNLEIVNKIYQHELEKLLEKRSQENIELMRMCESIINNSLMGLIIFQDDNQVFANSRTADIFGFPLDRFQQFSASEIMNLFHGDDHGKLQELMNDTIQNNGIPRNLLLRINYPGGVCKYVDIHSGTIQFKGKPAVYQTFLDITNHLK
jgi:CheY-like chemotaxis protein